MAHLLLSAAHKSSGKTTLAIGLAAAWRAQLVVVQTFKKGPDYIDPIWLGLAAGRPCYNLDFQTMQAAEIQQCFAQRMAGAALGLIEGNKGLFDGVDLLGSNSNAALAKQLQAPVVLVVDTRGMTRGIAPLLQGYQQFDKAVNLVGVILNRVGGARHEAKLRQVIAHYCKELPVYGAVQEDPALAIVERHLGLTPGNEIAGAQRQVAYLGERIAAQVDCAALMQCASTAPPPPRAPVPLSTGAGVSGQRVRIGIARDAAFNFYYPDDLEALTAAGAELVPFDALRDTQLPPLDGLFIAGGFPETQMRALAQNGALRADLQRVITAGLPTYAECGGLMYLARSIQWHDHTEPMVGVLPADVVMHAKPQGRGYVQLRVNAAHPWPGFGAGTEIAAHEFHYSSLVNLPATLPMAYQMRRGTGVDGQGDGLVLHNLLASYTHLRDTAQCRWAQAFISFVRQRGGEQPLLSQSGVANDAIYPV